MELNPDYRTISISFSSSLYLSFSSEVFKAANPHQPALGRRVPLLYTALDGKDVGKDQLKGLVSHLSKKGAEIELEQPLELLTNIKMNLGDVPEELASRDFYGKVIESTSKDPHRYMVRFTSASPEVAAYFQALRQYAAKGMSTGNA